ncbi:MAG: ABC transporter ATP-binding protein [Thermodesulfobacteriota bacterium]
MILEVHDVHAAYGKARILHGISFALGSGDVLCLLGPNGAGKSTLFKGILGFLRVSRGRITCDGEDVSTWSRSRMATTIGYIPQSQAATFQFTAASMVLMGRTAHLGRYATPSKNDARLAEQALETLGISHLKNALYTEISGGERQLVLIARALAQDPGFLIMDEPTSNLDYGNQILVLRHIQDLARNGLGILMASHQPDHAFRYASKALLIKNGRLVGSGSPDDTVTGPRLNTLYNAPIAVAQAFVPPGRGPVKVCVPVPHEQATTTQ